MFEATDSKLDLRQGSVAEDVKVVAQRCKHYQQVERGSSAHGVPLQASFADAASKGPAKPAKRAGPRTVASDVASAAKGNAKLASAPRRLSLPDFSSVSEWWTI